MENIDHTRTKAKSPQTNGICERFHRTIKEEFYSIIFRKKVFSSIEDLQIELDDWIKWYNKERTHSGKDCYGKTPWQTLLDSKHLAHEKQYHFFPWEKQKNGSEVFKNPLSTKDEGFQIPKRLLFS